MSQLYPATHTFTENATVYSASRHVGYARLVPWVTDTGSGDAIVAAVGNLSSAYFSAISGMPTKPGQTGYRASVFNASGSAPACSFFVWGHYYGTSSKARAAITHGVTTGLSTSFRFAGVGVRVAGQATDESTFVDSHIKNGDGYWLVLRNVATQPGAKFYLLRVNAGTVTKLTESAVVDISTLPLAQSPWISLQATTVGSTVVLQCRRGSTGRQAVDGLAYVELFGSDYVDSSVSRLTSAGRCGFMAAKPVLGSRTTINWFEISDSGTVVFRDEWLRSNLLNGITVGPDANDKSGKNLMPMFFGDHGGTLNTGLKLDAGNNRVRNDTAASTISLDASSSIPASHGSVQRRSAKVTFTTPGGSTDTFSIELRGNGLANLVSGQRCYRAEILCANGTTFSAQLVSYNIGVRTVLATRALSGLATGTAVTFDFETFNSGNPNPLMGTPNLVLRIDTVIVGSWTLVTTLGISQLAAGNLLDQRSSAILVGFEQGMRAARSNVVAGALYIDDWADSAAPPTPTADLTQIVLAGETAGVTGTLSPIFRCVDRTPTIAGLVHRYEGGYAQRRSSASRQRRRWKFEDKAAAQADIDELVSFWATHGPDIPFNWTTPQAEAVIVVFADDKLDRTIMGRDRRAANPIWRYEFEIEERFA